MEFDSIIACGDSFTRYHKTAIEKTWPSLLGEHYNVPWANLGKGGSSNYEISIQPLQNMPDNLEQFKKPLIIFGLTTPWRLPVFAPAEGKITSIHSILPEHLEYKPFLGVDEKGLEETIKRALLNDWFNLSDIKALEQMHKWGKIFKDSTIVWGSIHFQWDNPGTVMNNDVIQGIQEERSRLNVLHKHMLNKYNSSNCFNESIKWNPLQFLLDANDTHHFNWNDNSNPDYNPIDRHPTNEGIQVFADTLIKYIDSI